MEQIARLLITVGIFFIIIGIGLHFANKIPFMGRLPGDIFIKKENFSFYFPLTTCILISIILTFILYLWNQK